jgi:antitoxin component of MazEF toxin-antitoxin module
MMIKLPIRRKICKIGTGLAVFLPKSWVQLLEEKHGPVEAVEIEVNGSLKISPILKDSPNHA